MYILYSNTVKGETNNKPNHILLTWTKPKTKYNPRVLNHLQHKWKYSLSFRYSYIVPYYISRLDLFSAFHLSCPYIFNLRITIHALGIYVYWIGSKFKYKKLKLCSNVKNMGSFQSYVWCICSMNDNIETTLVFIYTHIIHSFSCQKKNNMQFLMSKKNINRR